LSRVQNQPSPPALGDYLFCRAEVLKPGNRITVVESEVRCFTGDVSKLVAKAMVTLAVLDEFSD
jgi:acyl-coenzyme A thioesterase PaaI-like protein